MIAFVCQSAVDFVFSMLVGGLAEVLTTMQSYCKFCVYTIGVSLFNISPLTWEKSLAEPVVLHAEAVVLHAELMVQQPELAALFSG